MTDEIVNFRKALAEKHDNSRLWTPLDALRDAIAEIEKGTINPTQLVIHAMEFDDQGTGTHHYFAAGISFGDHIALLRVSEHRVLRDWLK